MKQLGSDSFHIKCFAHTLNLAVAKAMSMNSVSKALSRIRKIVTYFHKSAIGATVLKVGKCLMCLPYYLDCNLFTVQL